MATLLLSFHFISFIGNILSTFVCLVSFFTYSLWLSFELEPSRNKLDEFVSFFLCFVGTYFIFLYGVEIVLRELSRTQSNIDSIFPMNPTVFVYICSHRPLLYPRVERCEMQQFINFVFSLMSVQMFVS